jgi:hypothetical protein
MQRQRPSLRGFFCQRLSVVFSANRENGLVAGGSDSGRAREMQSDEERELEQEGAEEDNEAEQMDQGSDEEQLGDDPFVPVEDGSDEEQLGDDQPFPDALREIALILFHNR